MRRRVGLFLLCGLVLPLVAAANASAQGAILELNPKSGPPGTVINVAGAGFTRPTVNIGQVQIRLSTRDALPVLRNALPDSSGRITTEFVVPDGLAPREYLVIATQTSVRGRQVFGGPGRAKLRVTAPAAATASAPPGPFASATTMAIGAAGIALILLAGGALALPKLRTLTRSAARRNAAEFSR